MDEFGSLDTIDFILSILCEDSTIFDCAGAYYGFTFLEVELSFNIFFNIAGTLVTISADRYPNGCPSPPHISQVPLVSSTLSINILPCMISRN